MNNRLLAPPIKLNTNTQHHDDLESGVDAELTPTASAAGDNNSRLSIHGTTSPTTITPSLDGETLRSRANSYNTDRSKSGTLAGEDPLSPDKGTEQDFIVEANPFGFTPGHLNKLLNPKSQPAFKALGGPQGLARGLRTDLVAGLSVDETTLQGQVSFDDATSGKGKTTKWDSVPLAEVNTSSKAIPTGQFQDRLRVYGRNVLPEKKATSIWRLIWVAYNDTILILLTVAAVISLALGLYETFGAAREPGEPMPVDWVEGVAICVAIIIVVIVTALNDWQKEKQFVKLNKKKDDREVKATRSGKTVMISVFDVTAGDVLHLEPGDLVPVDGIFISGHNVKCDESSATGESDQMKKTPGEEVYARLLDGSASAKLDPFIISGSKVLEGVGTYVVTSVGVNSSFGKTMMALRQETEQTPLQKKLDGLAGAIAKLGGGAALLLFTVLLIRFLAGLSGNTLSAPKKASQFLDILIVAVTIIVVAVPEGLPLAVTLALAFATTRMLKQNNLVRILRACETMGNATTICSDKTGTLTQNKMSVVAGTIGTNTTFAQSSSETAAASDSSASLEQTVQTAMSALPGPVKDIMRQSIVLNSTAFEGEDDGVKTYIGSKTETALLFFAKDHLAMGAVSEERANSTVVQLIPFDSGRKCMGAVMKLPSGGYRFFVKGAAEILLAQATRILTHASAEGLEEGSLTEKERTNLALRINSYAEKSLRTIAILYRDFQSWPPAGARPMQEDKTMALFEDIFKEMTFLGIVGIRDPLRPGVTESVKKCQQAGVVVRMVTGDNATTAHAIAVDCGIKTPQGLVMEGPAFRRLSEKEMDETLPRLQVLARSSPEDKRILVARLKHLGETVAVTGDGTNDAPALKTADIGFSMGIAGTEVAKEASSIILMDDNFSSIVTAIMWGRAVNDAVSKFLQFQITVNITAVLLAFISAVESPDMHSVLTAVQLLWVNLIMDTFAALALATDAPTPKILNRKPTPKSAPLITTNMWKMIIGQAVYQLVVTFILYFAGGKILGYDTRVGSPQRAQLNTMVFNTFVWMQIFNEFNNRRLDNKLNIFEGIHRNWFFIGINCVMVGGQVMIIFVGGKAFGITPINGTQWAICILAAIFCLPWAVVLRLIPDHYAASLFGFVVKGFRLVFMPVLRVWRALTSPIGRFSRRLMKKARGRRATPEVELAPIQEEEKLKQGSAAVPPPPITITSSP